MNLFLALVLSWVVGGLIINIIIRILLNTRLKSIMYIADEADYDKGYLAGITNLKMYYYIAGEIPSTNWLDKVKHTVVNNRETLETTMEKVAIE